MLFSHMMSSYLLCLSNCSVLTIIVKEIVLSLSAFTAHTLQKQIGCFNHRVVTLVAEELKRQWLCIVYFANSIRRTERKLPRPSHVTNHVLVDIVTTEHAPLKGVTPAFM